MIRHVAGHLGRKGQGRGLEILFAGLHIEHGSIATGTDAAPQVQLVTGGQSQGVFAAVACPATFANAGP